MTSYCYTIPYDYGKSKLGVFIFVCDPYRAQIRLHPYYKHRHVCAYTHSAGRLHVIKRRVRQIERWCKASKFDCEIIK